MLSLRCTAQLFEIYFEMIIIMILVNIIISMQIKKEKENFLAMTILSFSSLNNLQLYRTVSSINYSPHVVHYIYSTHLFTGSL